MLAAAVLLEMFLAALLLVLGYFHRKSAEEFCQRVVAQSENMRQPWRSILYPRWYYGTTRRVRHMEITGIGFMVMGAIVLILALMTLLSGR